MSTAALMHSATLTETVYELDNVPFGYRVHEDEYCITLSLIRPHIPRDELYRVLINKPRQRWSSDIESAKVTYSGVSYGKPEEVEALSQLHHIAAWVCIMLNVDIEEELARQRKLAEEREAQRRLRDEEYRRQREERERKRQEELAIRYKHVDALIDELKWMVGDEMRMKKVGKRSTIICKTLDKIFIPENDPRALPSTRRLYRHIHITTERDKFMDIDLTELEWLEVKDPDTDVSGKRTKWIRIYPAAQAETDEKEN